MAYLLVKTKKGAHIRKKSNESLENLENVAPAKAATWLALSEASHSAHGGTMEDIINRVREEMAGTVFKEEKPKVEVSEEEYESLLIQCAKKGITKSKLDSMVTLKKIKPKTPEEMVEEFIAARR